jgi:hypothetical protein
MNYYELESHMFDRHHEMVRKAESRRLMSVDVERPARTSHAEASAGFFSAIGQALRARVLPGRAIAVERPSMGDV